MNVFIQQIWIYNINVLHYDYGVKKNREIKTTSPQLALFRYIMCKDKGVCLYQYIDVR